MLKQRVFFTFIPKYYTRIPIKGITGLIIHCLCLQQQTKQQQVFLSVFLFFFYRRALHAHFNCKNRRYDGAKEVNYSQVLTRINGMSKG